MILKLNRPFRQILFQAFIPFLLYTLACCIETILPQISPFWSQKNADPSWIHPSKEVLLGFYSNYPLFMIAMLLLNSLMNVIKRPQLSKDQGIITQFLRNCLCFTLIYACFQVIPFWVTSQKISQDDDVFLINNGLKETPRLLEIEGEHAYLMRDNSLLKEDEEYNTEVFEVGKIIGSRPIEESGMTISKDGKTLFMVGKSRGMLRIFDISDNQNPKLLSTLALSKIPMTRSLLLSKDEKTLYISVGLLLEIVNVSNLKYPIDLRFYYDSDLDKLARGNFAFFSLLQTSMALSWDEKTLYVGGTSVFQIFSVEDPKQARLTFSSAASRPSESPFATSVATSADRKTLYFANGTVEVYDISLNPEEPMLKSTLTMGSPVNSLILGKDNKTLYAAGRAGEIITLERIAIEENSASLKSIESFNLGISSASPPMILEKSFSESTFFLFTTQNVSDALLNETVKHPVFRAYNLITQEILSHSSDLFPNATGTLRVIPNTKNFVVSKEGQLNIVSFFSNYPNPHSFALSNSTIGLFRLPTGRLDFAVPSSLGIDRLYAITVKGENYFFSIIDMSNKDDPKICASSSPLSIRAISLQVVESANRAFAIDLNNKIEVLDFSDLSDIQSLGLTQLESTEKNRFYPLKDGKTVLTYFSNKTTQWIQLKMLDFSDLSSTKILAEEKTFGLSENTIVEVSSQGIIFLSTKGAVGIYNLSAPASSRKIASIGFPSHGQVAQYGMQCSLFEEKGIIFIETQNQDTMHYLLIYNISEIISPKLLSTFSLPKSRGALIPARISSDALRAYFWDGKHILVIDLSDLYLPVIIGQIPVNSFSTLFPAFDLSGDDKVGYFDHFGEILMVNLQTNYNLYMKNNNFALGKKYAADFMILQSNNKSHFENFAESNYKILKLSLSKISLDEGSNEARTTLSSLPDWMTFDKENSLLNIEGKKERDVGNYTLYSACSLKIPLKAFSFIGNSSDVDDLVASLVSLGFLDNQRFLTSSFGDQEDFPIPSRYSAEKSKIYKALKKYSFETFTPFRLLPSLDLTVNSGSLSIQTPSLDIIKIDIKLTYNLTENEKGNPQFLLRNYGSIVPLITEHKTHLRIEGLLDEVNLALEKLVINNKTLLCHGEIIVTDNLNQPLVREVKNITKYFTTNKPPSKNLDVQNQISMVPVYTGEFVTISLNQNTFIDENVEKLNYKLVMNTPERHEKPSWLVFSNDLVMKITAPEELLNRNIELLLIAENEFEKVEVPFTLKIKLSPVYLLKLLIQLSPYILTIIGLYIKANKIYNIVAQKWYKHPKEFFVETGREIGPDIIPPIWFIAGEKREAKLILDEVCKKVGGDKEKIVDYFWDSEKLRQTIEEVVSEMKEKRKLKLYFSEVKERKTLINQLIENQFALWKLDLKQGKKTKEMYNQMKNLWVELVKWENSNNQFVIRQEKFDEILASFEGKFLESTEESISLSQVTHDESLLKKDDSQIDINLLKKSLLILAFNNHSLDMKGVKAYVKVKQREESNCLKRILRNDLIDVSFSGKGCIGYGIMYKIAGYRLEFMGMPEKHLKDELLVVQITNSHERILKELWIHGTEVRSEMMQSYGVL